MRGEGVAAERIKGLFEIAKKRAGLDGARVPMAVDGFRRAGVVELGLW